MAIATIKDQEQWRAKFQFVLGVRFELFYALQTLTDGESPIHGAWQKEARSLLPPAFDEGFQQIGGSPLLWPLVADALETMAPDASGERVVAYVKQLDPGEFQRAVLLGALHIEELVDGLLSGDMQLKDVVEQAPAEKEPWYTCLGIAPYRPEVPVVVGLERLVADPAGFQADVVALLDLFWQRVFRRTWDQVQDQLARSLTEKKRLFEASSLGQFLLQSFMRLEVDEDSRTLRAVQGGCSLPIDQIGAIYVMPSLFNDKNMWTTYENMGFHIAFIPYFDPSIALEAAPVVEVEKEVVVAHVEPAVVFKALGDSTRFAIAGLIGAEPQSAAELAKQLKVSKPTVSHHVQQLREAGLLNEHYAGGSVQLSLRREVIEQLSQLTVGRLFG
ncbi:MAG: metalloregulator ArsR/SmtB family transcription factor [Candidatus Latescibacteria bacterium]|nr:metalloregulator ArsR/SmtB family transcription factor [Candidatus Latescibacterota bacterium]